MKKLLSLIIGLLFVLGCKPKAELKMPLQKNPQVIYATKDNCSAIVPDYTQTITATDNCKLSWLIQDPAPGFLLTPENPTVTITMRAGDVSGNIKEMSFILTLVDTIKPVFIISSTSITEAWETVDLLYDTADRLLFQIAKYDRILPNDAAFIPDAVGNSYFEGLMRRAYPVLHSNTSHGVTTYNYDGVAQVDTSMFYGKKLIINTPPGHTYTGTGKRTFSFE